MTGLMLAISVIAAQPQPPSLPDTLSPKQIAEMESRARMLDRTVSRFDEMVADSVARSREVENRVKAAEVEGERLKDVLRVQAQANRSGGTSRSAAPPPRAVERK